LNEAYLQQARVLVVGCGFIGTLHTRILRELGVVHLAVCDPLAVNRANAQQAFGIAECYADLDEALEHGFDAALICTPPALHIPQALAAIAAGCDVLVEKPLSETMTGVDGFLEFAAQRNKLVMVGLCLRFHAGLNRVRERVRQGDIGRVIAARAMAGVFLPNIRPGVDYKNTYVAQASVGVPLDYLHEIDFVQWILDQRVGEVFAFTGTLSNLGIQANDTAAMLLRFENGAIGEIHLDLFQRGKRRQSEFMGTEGTILIDLTTWDDCAIKMFRAGTNAWETERIPTRRDDMYRAQNLAFLNACAARTPLQPDGYAGAVSLEIALAAMQSSREKRLVELGER
jgi:predicted dehydrogenase